MKAKAQGSGGKFVARLDVHQNTFCPCWQRSLQTLYAPPSAGELGWAECERCGQRTGRPWSCTVGEGQNGSLVNDRRLLAAPTRQSYFFFFLNHSARPQCAQRENIDGVGSGPLWALVGAACQGATVEVGHAIPPPRSKWRCSQNRYVCCTHTVAHFQSHEHHEADTPAANVIQQAKPATK